MRPGGDRTGAYIVGHKCLLWTSCLTRGSVPPISSYRTQNHGEEYRNLRLSDYSHSLYASFLKIHLAYSRKDFKTGEHLLGPRHVYNQLSFHQ